MPQPRLIPALLLSGNNLVKTRRFRNPTYVGDPVNAIRIFNEKEVDELIVLDIDASREGREPNYKMIEKIAEECFMPLCYGGGVQTVDQAKRILNAGVEKISVRTAALRNASFLEQLACSFGRQGVILSVDIQRTWTGKPRVTGLPFRPFIPRTNWLAWVKQAAAMGAGEILITAVDKDGTLLGPDLELIRELAGEVDVPVIASGGISSLSDIGAAVEAGASAVAAGAFFVFHGKHRAVLLTYPPYAEIQELFE